MNLTERRKGWMNEKSHAALEGRPKPFHKMRYVRGEAANAGRPVAAPEAARPRRPPRFSSTGQRMCDEPGCAWPGDRDAPDGGRLCGHHLKLRFGRLDVMDGGEEVTVEQELRERRARQLPPEAAAFSGFTVYEM